MTKLTGSIELGKSLTYLLSFSAALLFVAAMLTVLKRGPWTSLLFGVLVFMTPIFAYQYATYYVDAQVGAAFALAGSAIALWLAKPRLVMALCIAAALLLLANIKFNGLAYAAIIFLSFIVGVSLDVRYRHRLPCLAGVFALAVSSFLLVGFSPYVTNFRDHGHRCTRL